VLAALLVLTTPADFVVNVWPPHVDSVAWRYAAEGLLTGSLLTMLLGLFLWSWLAMMQGHRRMLRGLEICEWLIAVACVGLAVDFLLNAVQMRGNVLSQPGAMRTYDLGTLKGVVKYLVSAGFLAWLALAGRGWLRTHVAAPTGDAPLIRSGSSAPASHS
jgi:hypothetical protein